jgi:flavorubredoxin|tara:strand:- start:1597 stop:1860 length:264 start_codon:yes stop_codon:yes gene_type:complete
MSSEPFFKSGPFADAAKTIDEFGSNLYAGHYFDTTMKHQQELMQEYEEVLLSENKSLILKKREELEMCESMIALATKMFSYIDEYAQ